MTKILFVCTGNICRSPIAEALARHKFALMGKSDQFVVDGAGTGSWHVGECADPRTLKLLAEHGVAPPSRARQVKTSDFKLFDHIVALDESHRRDLVRMAGEHSGKVTLLMEHVPGGAVREVPDPYYGGESDYRQVYQMIESGVDAFVAKIVR